MAAMAAILDFGPTRKIKTLGQDHLRIFSGKFQFYPTGGTWEEAKNVLISIETMIVQSCYKMAAVVAMVTFLWCRKITTLCRLPFLNILTHFQLNGTDGTWEEI